MTLLGPVARGLPVPEQQGIRVADAGTRRAASAPAPARSSASLTSIPITRTP